MPEKLTAAAYEEPVGLLASVILRIGISLIQAEMSL